MTRSLYRRPDGRLVAGVAGGVAAHLGLDPLVVRAAFAVLAAANGAGLLVYAALWAVVPVEPVAGAGTSAGTGAGTSAGSSAEPGTDGTATGTAATWRPARPGDRGQLVLYAGLSVGLFLLVQLLGLGFGSQLWPLLLGALGVVVIWAQSGEAQRARLRAVGSRLPGPLRLQGRTLLGTVAGVVLVTAGVIAFLASRGALGQARTGLLAILATVLGVALVSAPWWVRLIGELSTERAERIRSQERAEVAAHLHDSVLQTLALIQRHSEDPRAVARLARSQERELRSWLYGGSREAATGLAGALKATAAEVEDAFAVPVEVVTVGDVPLGEPVTAVVAAAREAMINAAKSSGAPVVRVFAEVTPDELAVFVRDRGRGFVLDDVPDDRHGVRGSILARMERHGGVASVRSAPDEGTEVRLVLPATQLRAAREESHG